jgi:hypothetical protein
MKMWVIHPEDGGDMFLHNVGNHPEDYKVSPQLKMKFMS